MSTTESTPHAQFTTAAAMITDQPAEAAALAEWAQRTAHDAHPQRHGVIVDQATGAILAHTVWIENPVVVSFMQHVTAEDATRIGYDTIEPVPAAGIARRLRKAGGRAVRFVAFADMCIPPHMVKS